MELCHTKFFMGNSNYRGGRTFSETVNEYQEFINRADIIVKYVSHSHRDNGDISIMVTYAYREIDHEV